MCGNKNSENKTRPTLTFIFTATWPCKNAVNIAKLRNILYFKLTVNNHRNLRT